MDWRVQMIRGGGSSISNYSGPLTCGLLRADARSEMAEVEQDILIRSVCNTLVPKLVSVDKPLLRSLLMGVFPGTDLVVVEEAKLEKQIRLLCQARHLDCTDNFMEKCLQLYQIQRITHGVMMVGEVGTGKSACWKILLEAMVANVSRRPWVLQNG